MKLKKKFLNVLLVTTMAVGMVPTASYAAIAANTATSGEKIDTLTTFSDMPNNWSTTALQNGVANGLLKGAYGKIMPDENLTRAEMATVVVSAFGATVKGDVSNFPDIKSTDWYADKIAIAYQMGVIAGSDGMMNPNEDITREQVFSIIARALNLESNDSINKSFTDINGVSDWAKGSVYAIVNGGYIHGYDGKLNPKASITRAEFAQTLDSILKQYIRTSGEYTEVANGNIMVNTPNVTLKNLTVNGDLIVGDGVGEGNFTLDNVNITGRIVIRGGGDANSIIIKGESIVSDVILSRVDGAVSLKVQGDADVETIHIVEGSKNVNIEGKVDTVTIEAANIVFTAMDAQIETLNVLAENTRVIIGENSSVDEINIKELATNAKVEVEGTVNSIVTAADNTKITGTGTVNEVLVDADATGVTGIDGKEIKAGTTGGGSDDGSSNNDSSYTVAFNVYSSVYLSGYAPIDSSLIKIKINDAIKTFVKNTKGEPILHLKNGDKYEVIAQGYKNSIGNVNNSTTVPVIMTPENLYTVTFGVYSKSSVTEAVYAPEGGSIITISIDGNSQKLTSDANGEAKIDLENGRTYRYTVTTGNSDAILGDYSFKADNAITYKRVDMIIE